MPVPPLDWTALKAKLERAEVHIFDLKEFWDEFVEGGAYPILSQDTPDGRYRIYTLGNIAQIPVDVQQITGDAIQNLRSALDHLAYRLVCVGTDSPGPFNDVYFPLGDRPEKFEARIQAIEKRLKTDAVKALLEIEAYPGGDGEIFWQIDQLNNIDKHRLVLTVSSQNRFHSMAQWEIARIKNQFLGMKDTPEVNDPRMFLKSGIRHLSLQTGDVLGIFPISEVHEDMKFPVEVAFGEPKTVEGKPVIEMLHQAAGQASDILLLFSSKGLFG
jgi:hypothetical protein